MDSQLLKIESFFKKNLAYFFLLAPAPMIR